MSMQINEHKEYLRAKLQRGSVSTLNPFRGFSNSRLFFFLNWDYLCSMAVLGGIEKTATFGFANSIVKDFILYRENVGHANYL